MTRRWPLRLLVGREGCRSEVMTETVEHFSLMLFRLARGLLTALARAVFLPHVPHICVDTAEWLHAALAKAIGRLTSSFFGTRGCLQFLASHRGLHYHGSLDHSCRRLSNLLTLDCSGEVVECLLCWSH